MCRSVRESHRFSKLTSAQASRAWRATRKPGGIATDLRDLRNKTGTPIPLRSDSSSRYLGNCSLHVGADMFKGQVPRKGSTRTRIVVSHMAQMNPFAARFTFHRDGRGGLKSVRLCKMNRQAPQTKNGRLFAIATQLHLCCYRKANRGD
jgi:hypothetical protein